MIAVSKTETQIIEASKTLFLACSRLETLKKELSLVNKVNHIHVTHLLEKPSFFVNFFVLNEGPLMFINAGCSDKQEEIQTGGGEFVRSEDSPGLETQ